jgi:2-polyprenyl-3-methyl-5-hydroxy-6-metoxy-1,4-benzoquinol methylase
MKQEIIKNDFDSFAEIYETFVTTFLGNPWLGWDDLSGDIAIDIGCGAGQATKIIASKYKKVIGIDISKDLINIAKNKYSADNIEYLHMNLLNYQPNNKFDYVYSHTVMHHLNDYESGLQHIKTFVKRNGRLIIIDNVSDKYRTPPRWAYTLPAKIEFIGNVFKIGLKKSLFLLNFWHNKNWLAHLSTDKYLTRNEFKDIYLRVFPGAEIIDLGFANAIKWTNILSTD